MTRSAGADRAHPRRRRATAATAPKSGAGTAAPGPSRAAVVAAPAGQAAVAAAPRAWEDHGSTLRQFVAIEAALGGDFAPFEQLHAALARPYADEPAFAAYADPPQPEERVTQTFCGT